MKVVAVIPAYNEASVIADVVNAVRPFVSAVAVIDDGSRDNTAVIAGAAGAVVLRHVINRGYGAASMTGLRWAQQEGAHIAVTLDADGQFDSSEIPQLIEPIQSGNADVVWGNRFGHRMIDNQAEAGLSRRLLVLRCAATITRWYTGLPVNDPHNGFRAFSSKALSLIDCRQRGMSFSSEVLEQVKKHRLRFMEVPVTVRYTDYSIAKGQKLSNAWQIIWDLFTSRLF